jgi:nitrite reductase/ring-hydroxylating ferredoxin subunit
VAHSTRELHDWLLRPCLRSPARAAPAASRCAQSGDLAERGRAWIWDVVQWRQPARAFALRFDGRVVAYLNRCVHVPTEMDWQPGEFLDATGAGSSARSTAPAYEPADGRCVGGPCGRGRLTPCRVQEDDGQVYWYPSRDIAPGALRRPGRESPR